MRSKAPLKPADAVAGLLVLEDGRYVMQLRDARPNIFYPSHWGCFGGAVDLGERPLEALRRELREELEYEIEDASEFTRFDFDFSRLGQSKVSRIYFEISVPARVFARFVLHEGADMQALTGQDLLLGRQTTPYDAFAIWMHMSRHRFAPAPG
ncbi:MAG TPA: NUDIX domain-containing protein [Burkholderiales bacterium]|nr:NUDIX domain-containing protein [Burkholderiales bacterium]